MRDMTWRWSKEGSASGGIRFRWLAMALGMLPGLVGFALINTYFFNSPLANGYRGQLDSQFPSASFLQHLLSYVWMLMLLYPAMLVSPFFLKGRCDWEMKISCLGVLLFFSAYYFVESGNSTLETAVRALRFQLTVLPFYIVAYAGMITWLAEKTHARRFIRAALVTAAVLLCVGDSVMSRRLSKYSGLLASRQDELNRILPASGTVVAEARYVSAVTHPGLRLLHPWPGLPDDLRQEDLPVLLVLESGRGVRTEARRRVYDVICSRAVALVRSHFEIRPHGRSVEGLEIWEVVRKLQ
jgi:hypothetical protein